MDCLDHSFPFQISIKIQLRWEHIIFKIVFIQDLKHNNIQKALLGKLLLLGKPRRYHCLWIWMLSGHTGLAGALLQLSLGSCSALPTLRHICPRTSRTVTDVIVALPLSPDFPAPPDLSPLPPPSYPFSKIGAITAVGNTKRTGFL